MPKKIKKSLKLAAAKLIADGVEVKSVAERLNIGRTQLHELINTAGFKRVVEWFKTGQATSERLHSLGNDLLIRVRRHELSDEQRAEWDGIMKLAGVPTSDYIIAS